MKPYNVYPKLPITPVKAQGPHITDETGKTYLDLYGGHAVISIGHNHPKHKKYLTAQLNQLGYYSNAVHLPIQKLLAEKMGDVSGYSDYDLFLCNSGAEANENALKLASQFSGKSKVVAFKGAFHGRTAMALAASDYAANHTEIHQQLDVQFLGLEDAETLELALAANDCCAVIMEGVQGVAGVVIPSVKFLQDVEACCKKYKVPLILDEVQSGCGRTGKFFAHQHAGIQPDFITMAKGIGNGYPAGGVLISSKYEAKFGALGSTYGGNPMACAAVLAVLEEIEENDLANEAELSGRYLKTQLEQLPDVKEVRGIGLMIAIEFDFPIADFRLALLKAGVITGASGKNCIRLLPPLNIERHQLNQFIKTFGQVLSKTTCHATVH